MLVLYLRFLNNSIIYRGSRVFNDEILRGLLAYLVFNACVIVHLRFFFCKEIDLVSVGLQM